MTANVETAVFTREKPWHNVGTVLLDRDVLTADEALRLAELDWQIELVPAEMTWQNSRIIIPDRFHTVRDRDGYVMGTVGSDYVPFQNWEAFQFIDNLVDSGEAKYETAGALRHGKWIFMTVRLPEDILIGGEDRIEMFIVFATSHDGSKAITAMVSPQRVECENTLNIAHRRAKYTWSIRHIRTAGQRLQEARESLKLTFKYAGEFQKLAEELLAAEYTTDEFKRLADKLIPERPRKEAVVNTMVHNFENSPTLEGVRFTKWGALNAVGEYGDWLRDARTAESKLLGSWYGTAFKLRNKTLELLTA